jgi:ribosomal protein S18 acetylase RimI-like enzyme
MGIEIIAMKAADYDEVAAFWRAQPGVGLADGDDPKGVAQFLARNPNLSLIARDAGKIVAAIMCGHDGRRAFLYHLAVAPSHRRKGIGKQLVDRCIAALKELNIARCNIFVYADNSEGQGFWDKLAFKERRDLKIMQRHTLD